jgi:hypothetical protein
VLSEISQSQIPHMSPQSRAGWGWEGDESVMGTVSPWEEEKDLEMTVGMAAQSVSVLNVSPHLHADG